VGGGGGDKSSGTSGKVMCSWGHAGGQPGARSRRTRESAEPRGETDGTEKRKLAMDLGKKRHDSRPLEELSKKREPSDNQGLLR